MGKMSVNTNSNNPRMSTAMMSMKAQDAMNHFNGGGNGIGGASWHEVLKAMGASGDGSGGMSDDMAALMNGNATAGGGGAGLGDLGGQLAATGVKAGGAHVDSNFAARMAAQAAQASMPRGR